MLEDVVHVLALPYKVFYSIFRSMVPQPVAIELAACFYAMSALTITYIVCRLLKREVLDKIVASAIALLWAWIAGIAVVLAWFHGWKP